MKLFFYLVLLANNYTTVQACLDRSPYCSSWKNSGFCTTYFSYMLNNCQRSCDLCPTLPPTTTALHADCMDKSAYCNSYQVYCNNSKFESFLNRECKRTCKFCNTTTPSSPITQTTTYNTSATQPGCGHKGPGHDDRIVGGTNAEPGDWPWQVNIEYEQNTDDPGHWCGGTLINEDWVLSAAHCFHNDQKKERYWLKLGEHNIKRKNHYEQQFNISQLIIHPNYNPNNYDYDLALLRLNRNATLNDRVRPACLPDHKIVFAPGTECYISGWGHLKEYGNGPVILQQAKVPLVDHEICKQAFAVRRRTITPRMFCAGFSNGTIDACLGDSGGPLVCKQDGVWYLWGVISWGIGCAQHGIYGIYSNIVNARQWIDSAVF